jgi:hypothetical protein
MATVTGGPWPRAPGQPCKHLLPNPPSDDNDILFADDTLGQGSFGTWHVLPSTSMVDSVTGLRDPYAMPSVPVPPITLLVRTWLPDADY